MENGSQDLKSGKWVAGPKKENGSQDLKNGSQDLGRPILHFYVEVGAWGVLMIEITLVW